MNVKFISKQQNYRAVLKPGLPREPLTGREAVPAIYAKFENGVFSNSDPAIIEMMMRHPGYGVDYIRAEEEPAGFTPARKELEPTHVITEIDKGYAGNTINQPKNAGMIATEKMKEIQDFSLKLAVDLVNKKEDEIRKDERAKIMKELGLAESEVKVPETPSDPELREPVLTGEEDLGKVEIVDPDKEPEFVKKELKSQAQILNESGATPED